MRFGRILSIELKRYTTPQTVMAMGAKMIRPWKKYFNNFLKNVLLMMIGWGIKVEGYWIKHREGEGEYSLHERRKIFHER
jgi:hypothetical protein